MTTLIIVFGNRPKAEKMGFYDLLEWAKKRHKNKREKNSDLKRFDSILVVDKFYNQESDTKQYGVKHVPSSEFQVESEVHYVLALNLSNKAGIARVLSRIKSGNVSFEFGFIEKSGFRQEAY